MEKKVMNLTNILGECQAACNYCFDMCLQEEDVKMMRKCIKLDKECSEICSVTLSMLASNSPFAKKIVKLCASICIKCADECKKHNNQHCKDCAKACQKCADACNTYYN